MAGVTTSELGGAPPNKHFLKSLYDTCVDHQSVQGGGGSGKQRLSSGRHETTKRYPSLPTARSVFVSVRLVLVFLTLLQ